jgi:hypothetical protein
MANRMSPSRSRQSRSQVIFSALVLTMALLTCGWAQTLPPDAALSHEFNEREFVLKPLVDNLPSDSSPGNPTLLKGNAIQKNDAGMTPAGQSGTLVLTGQVQTLQQAMESESGSVDWYGWYLAARQYLERTGGLQCALGTPIKFYRQGRIEALSFNPICQASVSGRNFPLPYKTKLEALILPVRSGESPPASPQEIYTRIHARAFQ